MIARDMVTAALRKIGVVAGDEPSTADQVANGVTALTLMLRSWSNARIAVFQTSEAAVTLTTAASYALSSRPTRVLGVRLRRSGIDLPMQEMTRQEYDDMPLKTSAGTPTCWYLDRQPTAATIYVWPVLASADGETLRITYERAFSSLAQGDEVPILPEWEEAAVYCLADRLSDDYTVDVPKVTARAAALYSDALAADREGSVFFCGDEYRY